MEYFANSSAFLDINEERIPLKELKAYCNEKLSLALPAWEHHFYSFLEELLNESETVTGQTSGSTGAPTRILLEKEKMVASAELTNNFFGLKPNDTLFLCLSTHYIAGKMMVVRALSGNLKLIVTEPSAFPTINAPVQLAAMVPMQVINLLASAEGIAALNNIEKLIIGGGALDTATEEQLNQLHTTCYATYGMTETYSHIAVRQLNGDGKQDYFQALGNVTFETDGRDCLVIHAPHLSTEKFRTNDIVSLKNEREFTWVGRFDNVINSGGVKLFPETIEKKLASIIPNRFYIGAVTDSVLGEKAVLLIEGNTWDDKKTASLQTDIQRILSPYEIPKEIRFITQFKETYSGKVKRNSH